jgi:hypothetical protein
MDKNENKMPEIHMTRDYSLFRLSEENRNLDLKAHKDLLISMKEMGFLPMHPIVCYHNGNGIRVIKDGQHRFEYAKQLGLPVYYIETDKDYDLIATNLGQRSWTTKEIVSFYARHGNEDYRIALEFSDTFRMSLGHALAVLAGTVSGRNVSCPLRKGVYRIKDKSYAMMVGGLLKSLLDTTRKFTRKHAVEEACMAVCRVVEFSPERLIASARKNVARIEPCASKEAYLELFEDLYNHGKSSFERIPLKFLAEKAMKNRMPIGFTKRDLYQEE